MKTILSILVLAICNVTIAQTNLLDSSSWVVGNGSAPGFPRSGADAENSREMGATPYGDQDILWKGSPDGTTGGSNGGWNTNNIPIDHTKTYRYTVWMKKTNSFDGSSVLGVSMSNVGFSNALLKLDGTGGGNGIMAASDVPELNKWYLYVGFVHNSDHTGTTSIGGVYDPSTGSRVLNAVDYKSGATAVTTKHKAYLWSGDNPSDALYFYRPGIYEVNGQEPTLQELLDGINGNDTQDPTAPTLSSTAQTDTSVSLGWIGATDNISVIGYKIYKDGTLEATLGNVGTCQVPNLTASTTYSFTVTALDAAANESVVSNSVNVTTDASSGGGGGSGNWAQNGSDINYTIGNVGIGTTAQTAYRLAVDGKIHTKEVKVDLSGWADYVFTKEYELPTLEEVERHIKEKGHLINIPSAKEVEANGIQLGEMNRLLLEKIEELMLYTLEQERKLKKERTLNRKQEKRISRLERSSMKN